MILRNMALRSRMRSSGLIRTMVARQSTLGTHYYYYQHQRAFHPSPTAQQQDGKGFPAWFVRGGTSNGLVINQADLPGSDQTAWRHVLPAAMGSPDPVHARQLDGMGSGVSSTSKIIVLSPASREDVDVDYTFVQVGIRDGELDTAGNCGNMSSAVGPVAWDWGLTRAGAGLVEEEDGGDGQRWAEVRMLNTNTNKILRSRFRVSGSPPRYDHTGSYSIDGVPGSGSLVTLDFLRPGGAKTGKVLPAGGPMTVLDLPDSGTKISASLVDVSNPGVFVAAADVERLSSKGEGKGGVERKKLTPASVEADDALKKRLEEIRRAGAVAMGLNPDVQSVPKVVVLRRADDEEGDGSADIECLAMSMGQAHRAVPLTLALCLGAACQIPGTVAAELASRGAGNKSSGKGGTVTIAHPSGKLEVGTTMGEDGEIEAARLLRTMRVLMKGEVCY